MMRRIAVAAWLLCCAAAAGAQDAPEAAPDLTRGCELLDEAPNYADGAGGSVDARSVPIEVPARIGRAGRNFGLLLDGGPAHSVSLQESIALALQNNTELQGRATSIPFPRPQECAMRARSSIPSSSATRRSHPQLQPGCSEREPVHQHASAHVLRPEKSIRSRA